MTLLLTTAYFPPIPWICAASGGDEVLIEKHENFIKQTFRNRCEILSANGKMALSVPLAKNHRVKSAIADIEIDFSTPWKRLHVQAIKSAYGKSPFFIHYFDEIEAIILSESQTLWELNNRTIDFFSSVLKFRKPAYTEDFVIPGTFNGDLREIIHPKKEWDSWNQKEYIQTFSEKFPFMKSLSALDLIFNLGPDAKDYIRESCSF